jgi:acetyl-CoA acetyltransferase
VPLALRYFGGAGLAHMQQYGTQMSTFAKIRAKASRHASNNPVALFRTVVTEDEVNGRARHVARRDDAADGLPAHLRRGRGHRLLAALRERHGLDRSVRIKAQAMTTDRPITFESRDMREVVGFSMAQEAAQKVYDAAGVGPQDIDVVELHDCFAHNELLSYEALGLCPVGGAEKFVVDGDNTYGGKVVTNPSGGLLSKGHPLGATGLAQCTELVQQLRGTADKRQVEGARLALQHNLGLGGACVVTLYERV